MPEGFNVHRKLRRPLGKRTEALAEGGIDFGQAEALAFSSLLTEGVHIRLTGQDTERGTFSHRHLVLHDENTGLKYTPDAEPRRRQGAVRAATTARSRRSPASASSTATRRRRRARWSSGRPSSATSPTPPR